VAGKQRNRSTDIRTSHQNKVLEGGGATRRRKRRKKKEIKNNGVGKGKEDAGAPPPLNPGHGRVETQGEGKRNW